MSNLRLALRTLFKTPFVTIVAIVSLALGIGANAAIFSLFDQMLLRSLPGGRAGSAGESRRAGAEAGLEFVQQSRHVQRGVQLPDVQGPRARADDIQGLAAHREFDANLAYRGQTLNGEGMNRIGQLFSVVGSSCRRSAGCSMPEDDTTVGGHFVVVLSECATGGPVLPPARASSTKR